MIPPFVDVSEPITLIGGAQTSPGLLAKALNIAPRLVAADGGANWAMLEGHVPEAIIGDLDSVSAAIKQDFPDLLHYISEQETTDFDKALRFTNAPVILAVGMLGGRVDHTLGALNVLVRHGARRCLLMSEEDVTCLCPPNLTLDLPVSTPLSLFPMGNVGTVSTGLEWATDHLRFSPSARIGTSNAVADGRVTLAPDAPLMLLTVPLDYLGVLVDGVAAAATWP